MKPQRFYPIRQGDQLLWLDNFWRKLRQLATPLQFSAGDVADAVADAQWLHYFIGSYLPAVRAFSKVATETLSQVQSGTGGALARIFDLFAEIKENNLCTEANCTDLGITGSVDSARCLDWTTDPLPPSHPRQSPAAPGQPVRDGKQWSAVNGAGIRLPEAIPAEVGLVSILTTSTGRISWR